MNRSEIPIRRTWALLIARAAAVPGRDHCRLRLLWHRDPRRRPGHRRANAEGHAGHVGGSPTSCSWRLLCATLRSERLAWSAIGWRLEQGQAFGGRRLIGVVPGASAGRSLLHGAVAGNDLACSAMWATTCQPASSPARWERPSCRFSWPMSCSLLRGGEPVPRLRPGSLAAALWHDPGCRHLVCVLSGLLHWAGGLWYILLTGVRGAEGSSPVCACRRRHPSSRRLPHTSRLISLNSPGSGWHAEQDRRCSRRRSTGSRIAEWDAVCPYHPG